MESFELSSRARPGPSIDLAPLMDMVFILLIFFIVTSTFTRETGVEVEKPKAQTASQVEKQNIMIAITREGTIHVNERQVDLAALRDILQQMLLRNPDREVVLIADKKAETGMLIKVMDAGNLAGAKKLSIAALVE